MRHQPVQVTVLQTGLGQHRARCFLQHADRQFEYALAVHFQHRVAQNLPALHVAGYAQESDMFTVCVYVGSQNAGRIRSLQHHGTGAVAKQHAGGAVVEIEQTGEHLGTHDQGPLGITGADHGVSHAQGVYKTGTDRLHIKRRCTGYAAGFRAELRQFVLQYAGGGRKDHVRRGSRHNQQINILRSELGRRQRLFASFKGQIAAIDTGSHEMAGTDTGALDDPVVRGLHAFGGKLGHQVGVAESTRRQVTTGAGYSGKQAHSDSDRVGSDGPEAVNNGAAWAS